MFYVVEADYREGASEKDGGGKNGACFHVIPLCVETHGEDYPLENIDF